MFRENSINRYGPLVAAIDEGTSSARFLVFAARTSEVLTYHQKEIKFICPKEGWVEQDPIEILNTVEECINQTVVNLKQLSIDPTDIIAIGITNQRETTVVWDSVTGKPLYNAIVWMDMRTTTIVDELLAKTPNRNHDILKPLCGLPISPYFSALKLKWLIQNVPEVQEAIKNKRCKFGTIDSWLIWNLTGGPNGGVHCTDVTNASRTMLMHIANLNWDPLLLKFFQVPSDILPEIRSSSEIYGPMSDGLLRGVPISGCLGDQQAALVGQMCLQKGQVKCTYGTGCFLLYNTGNTIVNSSNGLLTTVAYQLGPNAEPVYAIEGSVAIAGGLIQWMKDNLEILTKVEDCESISNSVAHSDNRLTFVPAFSGLYAPYWKKDAQSVICGLTRETTGAHFIKAALQSVCFQTRDILKAMNKDTGLVLSKLLVDGGMTINNLFMQMQADICGITIIRPLMSETTSLGAAMFAGSAEGIKKWNWRSGAVIPSDTFTPSISDNERDMLYSNWKRAIHKSLHWDVVEETAETSDVHQATAFCMYVFSSVALMMIANMRAAVSLEIKQFIKRKLAVDNEFLNKISTIIVENKHPKQCKNYFNITDKF